MTDPLSLTYKDGKLKIMLGDRELSLNSMLDPADIVLSADRLPTLKFEMIIDDMEIDDIDAFGRYVSNADLKKAKAIHEDNKQ